MQCDIKTLTEWIILGMSCDMCKNRSKPASSLVDDHCKRNHSAPDQAGKRSNLHEAYHAVHAKPNRISPIVSKYVY